MPPPLAALGRASVVLLVLATSLGSATAGAARPDAKEYWGRDRPVDVLHLRLEIGIDLSAGAVSGNAQLRVKALHDGTREAEVDAADLRISAVSVDGRTAPSDHDGKVLRVTFDPPLAEGEERVIRVDYAATPRTGLFFVRPDAGHPDKQLQCWSQGETEENRYWFPCFDHPNERATSETLVTVESPLQVVANGPLLEVRDNGDGTRTWHHRMDFPHTAYLVSIAVADWATRSDSWNGIELTYHVPKARAADMDRTFGNTARILEAISEETGVKYPYPVYRQTCVSDFMFGGMENIAATTLTDLTLHDERAHSDWRSDGLVAHEAAHQWFGDYVTTEDWSDTWLNEGFATYYGAVAIGHVFGSDDLVADLDGMRRGAIDADKGDKRRPIVTNRYVEPFDLFDGHAYAKGGSVLNALRRELGDALFRQAVRAYLVDHAGQSVNTHAFIDSIERSTGRDVSRFFDQWIYGAGNPALKVGWTWRDGVVTLTVEQVQEKGEHVGLFDVPLDVEILGDGWTLERPVRLNEERQVFHLESASRPEAVVVDPRGWLIRTIEMDRPDREALWVAARAPQLLSRMEAVRELKETAGSPEVTAGLVDALRAGPWPLRREAAEALGRAANDAAEAALLDALRAERDSRVRSAVALALGSHEGAGVRPALHRALASDASYAVMARAADALGKLAESPSTTSALHRALSQRSHREEVFKAALSALAEVAPAAARSHAERWTAYGRPSPARNHAVAVLAKLASESSDEALRVSVRERLVGLLGDPSFTMRRAAAEALGALGDAKAMGDLERLASSAPEARMRGAARRAADSLRAATDEKAKVADLSRRLADEVAAREKLERRLGELEGRVGALDGKEDDADREHRRRPDR